MAVKTFGEVFLDLAYRQIGKPYVWGGEGPNGFDCSGLIMWCYRQLTRLGIPHNDEVQWRWWQVHPDLGQTFGREIGGPENLRPGDLIWCQFEGGSGNGHEMLYVGSVKQSPQYANPAWAYTYLQAPATGQNVKLSEFRWDQRDTAHGGARGFRFGRFCRMKYPPGMEPKDEEEDEMFEVVVPFERVADQTRVLENGKKEVQHVWVASEGWWDLAQAAGSCYLVIKNESDAVAPVDIFTTPGGGNGHYDLPDKDNPGSRGVINMQALGAPKGGFATTVKSTNPSIVPQITILAKEK